MSDKKKKIDLGGVFKQMRLYKGLDQKMAAEELGVSQSRICQMEGGMLSMPTLSKIAYRFGLEIDVNINIRDINT